ncbi:MAG TPA: hypothetical protein VGC34_14225 [Steroidobacteraceae bacterium]
MCGCTDRLRRGDHRITAGHQGGPVQDLDRRHHVLIPGRSPIALMLDHDPSPGGPTVGRDLSPVGRTADRGPNRIAPTPARGRVPAQAVVDHDLNLIGPTRGHGRIGPTRRATARAEAARDDSPRVACADAA